MKIFKSLLLVVLIFMAGVVAGVVATRIVVRHVVGEVLSHPETVQPRIERNLVSHLQLDRDQRTKLHAILSNAHEQMQSLRQEYRPKMILVLSNADAQVAALLTLEQQARYERWKEKNRPLIDALKHRS